MADDTLYEFELGPKALIGGLIGATIVAVVVFLGGMSVGRRLESGRVATGPLTPPLTEAMALPSRRLGPTRTELPKQLPMQPAASVVADAEPVVRSRSRVRRRPASDPAKPRLATP